MSRVALLALLSYNLAINFLAQQNRVMIHSAIWLIVGGSS